MAGQKRKSPSPAAAESEPAAKQEKTMPAESVTEGSAPTMLDIEKQKRVRELRLKFSRRPDSFPETASIIDDEGNLNKEYFSRTHLAYKEWKRADADKLIEGLRECSLRFSEIREKFLPEWSEKELRVRTMRLLGQRNLSMFRGFNFKDVSPDFFKEQYERNFEEGTATGQWANGVLDDSLPVVSAAAAAASAETPKEASPAS